jgi:hypothetical protein
MLGTLKAFGAPPPVFGFGIRAPTMSFRRWTPVRRA